MANIAIVVGRMKDAVSMQGLIKAANILQTCLATNITNSSKTVLTLRTALNITEFIKSRPLYLRRNWTVHGQILCSTPYRAKTALRIAMCSWIHMFCMLFLSIICRKTQNRTPTKFAQIAAQPIRDDEQIGRLRRVCMYLS
jgi:hypothetical protein